MEWWSDGVVKQRLKSRNADPPSLRNLTTARKEAEMLLTAGWRAQSGKRDEKLKS
jgi:hypothetical protein